MTRAEKQTEKYRAWWLGKSVNFGGYNDLPKQVKDVEFIGPPSGVYGIALFKFSDESEKPFCTVDGFKPRKRDVEIVAK